MNLRKSTHKLSLILAIFFIFIAFIYRYSYISILGFDRPLKLVSFIAPILGLIGFTSTIIIGVNNGFRKGLLIYMVLNLSLIFTYPILIGIETFLTRPTNPYVDMAPDKGNKTNKNTGSAFIIEGEVYKFPIRLADFEKNGYTISIKEDKDIKIATIKAKGASNKSEPTWFTDGKNEAVFKEFYLLEAKFPKEADPYKEDIKEIKASVINNNRDFQVMGIHLEDSIRKIGEKYELSEDENNKKTPTKKYYLDTGDGRKLTLTSLNGYVVSIEIREGE